MDKSILTLWDRFFFPLLFARLYVYWLPFWCTHQTDITIKWSNHHAQGKPPGPLCFQYPDILLTFSDRSSRLPYVSTHTNGVRHWYYYLDTDSWSARKPRGNYYDRLNNWYALAKQQFPIGSPWADGCKMVSI
jgi:hypothetical protein